MDVEKSGAGRPFEKRSLEIMAEMEKHIDGTPFEMALLPGEQKAFVKFSQRCRTVGRHLGHSVSVKIDRNTHATATVRVL